MDALFSHVTFVANNKVTPVPYTLFATAHLYYGLSYDHVVACVLCTYDNSICYAVVCNYHCFFYNSATSTAVTLFQVYASK